GRCPRRALQPSFSAPPSRAAPRARRRSARDLQRASSRRKVPVRSRLPHYHDRRTVTNLALGGQEALTLRRFLVGIQTPVLVGVDREMNGSLLDRSDLL